MPDEDEVDWDEALEENVASWKADSGLSAQVADELGPLKGAFPNPFQPDLFHLPFVIITKQTTVI